ncbi:hypothetical protein [Streptomyces sp. TLI_171]|uniref:hypothetical protein n=1 Tax=Streptomyces sp. TLI_171 TaxID=1938859 RepID=UPI000C671B82|nr:hypothetical protein [Streptomyces sp. TLI_171]RKE19592.1 hypothetical protein BX266_2915 [Streptomyces sp. TLI_171]
MRALRTLAVACLAAGVLTACSSSGGSTDAKTGTGSGSSAGASQSASAPAADGAGKGSKLAPKEALLASAAVMDKVGSAQLTLSGDDTEGTADYVWKAPESFLMNAKTDGQEAKVLFLGDVMYIGVTPDMASVAGGKKWMKLDPKATAATGAGGDVGGIAAMMQVMNPSVQLLAAAPAATLVGTETVAGQSATHYRSEIKVDDMVAKMQLSADLKAQVLAELKKNGSTSTVDLWINAKGELVQQSSTDMSSKPGAKPGVVTYSKLGTVKPTQAPAASDVFSLDDLLKQ